MEIPNNGQVMEQGSDRSLMVRFHMHPVQMNKASAEAGRPIFEDRLFVNIMVPGDRTTEVDRPATDADKQRFPRHWELFQRSNGEGVIGTPLKEWPLASASMIREWNALGVYTVDQLANMSDANIGRILGGTKFREAARNYLKAAADQAPITAMQQQLAERDNTITTLTQRLADLEAAVAKSSRKERAAA